MATITPNEVTESVLKAHGFVKYRYRAGAATITSEHDWVHGCVAPDLEAVTHMSHTEPIVRLAQHGNVHAPGGITSAGYWEAKFGAMTMPLRTEKQLRAMMKHFDYEV